MDKQNNDTQTDTNTKPKGNGVGKTATIAVVAALIGGGAGGGLAYYGFSRMSADSMGVTSKSGDAGTTAVTKTTAGVPSLVMSPVPLAPIAVVAAN